MCVSFGHLDGSMTKKHLCGFHGHGLSREFRSKGMSQSVPTDNGESYTFARQRERLPRPATPAYMLSVRSRKDKARDELTAIK